jgi:hypothetical protein
VIREKLNKQIRKPMNHENSRFRITDAKGTRTKKILLFTRTEKRQEMKLQHKLKPVAPESQEAESRTLRRQDKRKNPTAHSKGKIDFFH